ncbi:MAG: transposase [Nitrospirae bacterium]|nr:transposase [Nitrospirota bacterium]
MPDRTTYNREIHHRRSIRLKGYDYSLAGAYFVTVCTWNKECLFGEIVDGEMRMNEYGRVVQDCWDAIPRHFRNVLLDAFVVMPNHVHGILVCTGTDGSHPDRRGAACCARTINRRVPANVIPGSLGAIVRSFKSAATRRINVLRCAPGVPVWQRNYYEQVVRDDSEMHRVREYFTGNPAGWLEDEENPVHFVGATVRSPLP